LVDSPRSDVGWLVEGVSGRVAWVSDCTESTASALVARMVGSSTASAESWVCCLLFRLAFLAGQGKSGCDNHGSYSVSACPVSMRNVSLTGGLKGLCGLSCEGEY
jgi:hypothetical protein